MFLQAISVCINFSHHLKLVAADNIAQLDRWIVITSPNDSDTIAICEKNGIEIFLTNVEFCPGKLFPKGAMINEAFNRLTPGDAWVLLLDTDMRLPTNTRELISQSCVDKTLYYTTQYRSSVDGTVENICGVEGFFQLFHYSQIKPYPSESLDSAGDDDRFTNYWNYWNRRNIPGLTPEHVGYKSTGGNRLGILPKEKQ